MFDSLVAVVLRPNLGNIVIDERVTSDPSNRRIRVIGPLILLDTVKCSIYFGNELISAVKF